jgi:L-ascorbate metabolism protein UlaG (beta-lactamase superfamily)
MTKNTYFKQNVVVEPLYNQWYAWPNLIPPALAAMYISNWHLKIMESFVAAPQAHVSALKNPAMIGGPFMNHDESKVGEVQQLLDRTRKEQAQMLEFAEAIKSLDDLLQSESNGDSLEPFYPKIPDILRGYVELVYDLHHHPSARFIEGLLYRSKYYNPGSQSLALLEPENGNRSFVFSTPRLKSDGYLFLAVPFNHQGIDELFKMRFVPQPYEYIREILEVNDEDHKLFSSFFTTVKPNARVRYQGDGIRIRYFGHACVLIETRDVSILSDPVISYNDHSLFDQYVHADLPEMIDYVLITHGHQDHIIFESLLQLRHQIRNLIVPKSSGAARMDPSLKLILQTIGFANVREIDELESIEIGNGRITGLPFLGEHSDLNVRTKMTYIVELMGNSILLAADASHPEPRIYEYIHELFGDLDILFLGMECEGAPMSWLYGPLFTIPLSRKNDQSRRMNGADYDRAITVVDILKPKKVYVYAMGQEPWLTFLTSLLYTEKSFQIVESNRLVEECLNRGLVAERLYIRKEISIMEA